MIILKETAIQINIFGLTAPNAQHDPDMLKNSSCMQLSRSDINFGSPKQSMDPSKIVSVAPKSTQDTRENAYGLAAAHLVISESNFLAWQFWGEKINEIFDYKVVEFLKHLGMIFF